MITSALTLLPPETAHVAAIQALGTFSALLPAPQHFQRLSQQLVEGLEVSSPIGLAAGFDKHGQAIGGCFRLGFGTVEVGSITPQPQPGNPQPRVFRLRQDQAVVNRYGFNSLGSTQALANITKAREAKLGGPLGINLGKNKEGDTLADYAHGLRAFASQADYITINLSSPNTPGLRDQQNLDAMRSLLQGLEVDWPSCPVFVKLAPDLADQDLDDLVDMLVSSRVDGLILGNTSITRPDTLGSPADLTGQAGGLSGAPIFELSLAKFTRAARANQAAGSSRKLSLIGCGGISTLDQVLAYIRAGASMVQLYTGLLYQGPWLAQKLNRELDQYLYAHALSSLDQLRGKDL